MVSKVVFSTDGAVGVVQIDNPPVNAIDSAVTQGLSSALDQFIANRGLTGLVICCSGRTFVAGGDISAFDDPDFSTAPFNSVLARIEALDRPVVAAVHGSVLGGGLELALACHTRIAAPGTSFGMPEITLGLIPGSLGTQRLPRLVGLREATQLILSGQPIDTVKALDIGLIHSVGEDVVAAAKDYVSDKDTPIVSRTSQMVIPDIEAADEVLAEAQVNADETPWLPAPRAALEALTAAGNRTFAEGEKVESALFAKLVASPESRALRHLFTAERAAKHIPDAQNGTVNVRPITRVGVLGIGTMGAGISMAFANAGYSVTMVETSQDNLERGTGIIADTFAASVRRGKVSQKDADRRQALLTRTTDITELGNVDLVVEAVFEDMDLKLKVAKELGRVVKPGCIIATNTSTLDVDKIALASGRPGDVIGTHFFSPAHIMKLLEIVRGAKTELSVVQTLSKVATKIGKTSVVSGVCYGFIGNRMAEVYMRENEALQLEGATPSAVDSVMEDPAYLGMAMGPNRMLDMAGVDVGAKTVIEWVKSGSGPQNPSYRALCRAMFEQGRHGQKTTHGYYKYEGRTALPSPEHEQLARQVATQHGVQRRNDIPKKEIFERLLYSMINEAALILEEQIAYRGGDIDVVWTAGYGFPKWRGGPLFMADEIGLHHIVERIQAFADLPGGEVWSVAPLLKELSETGGRLSDW